MNKNSNISRKQLVIDKVKEKKIVEINQEDSNKKCFDCDSLNPQYISLYNAIFICQRCVNNLHRIFNSNISLILDNDLHKLSVKDIQYLYYGGNKTLFDFINYEFPILKSIDRNKLYITKGMDYYRRWLKFLIDDGEKPIKPSLEECSQLITDIVKKKINDKKVNKNRNKQNIINIDFINNYYNYEDNNKNPTITNNSYSKTYTTNLFNNLNEKRAYSTFEKEKELNSTNNYNTEYHNNKTIITERENNNFHKKKNNNNINKKIIKIKKVKSKINLHNSINAKASKLITKKLNLKSKKIFKGRIKDISLSRNDNSSNIITKSTENNNLIYTKPKHTLLTSFQKNVPSRNRENIEDYPKSQRSYIIPTGNNYQSILINNNNFNKLLMYNFTDRSNNPSGNINFNNNNTQIRKGEFFNSMKLFNFQNYFDNSNTNSHSNLEPNKSNKEIIFKKKNLKNSFSIGTRKKKDKKNNFKNNQSIENIHFQITSNKNSTNDIKKHMKLNSAITNNSFSIENKKKNEIIKEIKVKKNQKYIILENKTNPNLSNDINKNENDNLSILKNNVNNAKNETDLTKLLTLTRLMKNNMKMTIPEIPTLSNCNTTNNKTNNKISKISGGKGKEKEININKNIRKKIKINTIEKNNLKESKIDKNNNLNKSKKQWEILNYLLSKKNK